MRIQLKKINNYIFSTPIRIRITDLNYGNHLSNEMILSYVQQARVDFLKKLGNWTEIDLAGGGLIMVDAAVVYKSEGHAGELLEVLLAIDDISKVGFDFYYKIIEKESKREIALVKTGIIFFNYKTKKIMPIPSVFLGKLEKFEV